MFATRLRRLRPRRWPSAGWSPTPQTKPSASALPAIPCLSLPARGRELQKLAQEADRQPDHGLRVSAQVGDEARSASLKRIRARLVERLIGCRVRLDDSCWQGPEGHPGPVVAGAQSTRVFHRHGRYDVVAAAREAVEHRRGLLVIARLAQD